MFTISDRLCQTQAGSSHITCCAKTILEVSGEGVLSRCSPSGARQLAATFHCGPGLGSPGNGLDHLGDSCLYPGLSEKLVTPAHPPRSGS